MEEVGEGIEAVELLGWRSGVSLGLQDRGVNKHVTHLQGL